MTQYFRLLKSRFYQICIKIYLRIYQYYILLQKLFFLLIGNIIIIHQIDNNVINNVTLKYYLGYKLNKSDSSLYHAKIYNIDGTSQIAFKGDINQVRKIKKATLLNIPKRKNVILLNENIPIDIDLDIFDNYKINVEQLKESSITNLSEITQILGIKCTHVSIIEKFPFKKVTTMIKDMDINDLYLE